MLSVFATVLHLLPHFIVALEVAPKSTCSELCMNDPNADFTNPVDSSTQPEDVICNDWELDGYNSTDRGRKWKDCISCENTSGSLDTTTKETDTYWFLYNIKATIILCVWRYPKAPQIPSTANALCADTCGATNNSMKAAMMERSTEINNDLQYNYCTAENNIFAQNYQACSDCLKTVPQGEALVNYLRALNDACTQQPSAGTEEQVELGFPLFPNATDEAPNSASASASGTETPTTAFNSSVGAGATSSAESMSKGTSVTKVGLGVGIGLGVPLLAALAGCLFLLWRRRVDQQKADNETARRIEWENEFRDKIIAEVQELHDGTRPPEMTATPLVEADAGPPAVPEKDSSHLAPSSVGTSTLKSPVSLNNPHLSPV